MQEVITPEGVTVQVPELILGQPVIYIGTKGVQKAALVVNTPETVKEGTALPALEPGQIHLVTWTHSAAHFTPRYNVPFEGLVADALDFQEDGQTVGVWKV